MKTRASHTDGTAAYAPVSWLRRTLWGYRRDDVLELIDAQRRQIERLAESLDRVWIEKQVLAGELAQVRTTYEEQLTRERTQRIEAEARARVEAAKLLAEAEEQAARIRHDAGQRVGDAADRIEDLLRVREQLLGELRGILHAYTDLLGRAERDEVEPVPQPERPQRARRLSRAEARQERREDRAEQAVAAGLFPRRVDLDAGPFADFSALSAFERALAQLPKVADVHVRSFSDERAHVELTLTEETPLAHDLARVLPPSATVTPLDDGRLALQLAAGDASG